MPWRGVTHLPGLYILSGLLQSASTLNLVSLRRKERDSLSDGWVMGRCVVS